MRDKAVLCFSDLVRGRGLADEEDSASTECCGRRKPGWLCEFKYEGWFGVVPWDSLEVLEEWYEERWSERSEAGVNEGFGVRGVVGSPEEDVVRPVSNVKDGEFADNFLEEPFAKRNTDFQV